MIPKSHKVSSDLYKCSRTGVQIHTYTHMCTCAHRHADTKWRERLIILIKLCYKQLLARLSRSIISVKWSFFVIKCICLFANHVKLPQICSSYFSCCCYKILNKINLSTEAFCFLFRTVRRGWQESEAVGHIPSNQEAGAPFPFRFLLVFSLGPQLMQVLSYSAARCS